MSDSLFNNYSRFDVTFQYGEGCALFDDAGRRYLDFGSGIAVSSLGHSHPALVAAIQGQATSLLHCSNLYHIAPQQKLAERLCRHSFADRVLFCNSGLEANEAALKLVRKYHHQAGKAEKSRFIAVEGAFHGRSLAQIGASGETKMIDGFAPLPDWYDRVAADDLATVEQAITAETGAIIIEPLQGDGGGIHLFSDDYLRGLRTLCDCHELLLIFDEIQCGAGRTGTLWCYEHSGVIPDIMTAAKGLGGGVPIGAVLAKEEVARALTPGSHGTTFGGNPLAMSAGLAVLETLTEAGFLEQVRVRGEQLGEGLDKLFQHMPDKILEVRGLGLMRGLALHPDQSVGEVCKAALDAQLLVVPAGRNVLRIMPPLIVDDDEIDEGLSILHDVLKGLRS